MKIILFLLFLSIFSTGYTYIEPDQLHPGDIILLPLRCHICQLIESETNSNYSHSGIVIGRRSGELLLAQALHGVELVPLSQFLSIKDPSRPALLVRPQEFINSPITTKQLMTTFKQEFAGAPFDHDFLWNNYSETDEEMLYCSEFITKFLNKFLINKITPTPMSFIHNYSQWEEYLGHPPPSNEPGVTPAYFTNSPLFKVIDYLLPQSL